MKKIISYILKNKRLQYLIYSTFFCIVFFVICFLTINLYIFYRDNITSSVDAKLFYNFKPNTVSGDYDVLGAGVTDSFLSYGVSYGIDVSEWQGSIDWNKVKATGINFVMIRCGYREISGGLLHEDARFRENIEGASAAGLKVGVYFFGVARNTNEALEEAEFTYNLIKDYNITYPVAYDAECFNKGRLIGVSNSDITDSVLYFTETLEAYGYDTMIYANSVAFTYYFDTGKLNGKLIWLANYDNEVPDYNGNYDMWQYTSSGYVDGINTNVDLNISYFKYVTESDNVEVNPNYKYAPTIDFEEIHDYITTKEPSIIRSDATSDMPNKIALVGTGTKLERIGISDKFSKIIYKGRVTYIENSNIKK